MLEDSRWELKVYFNDTAICYYTLRLILNSGMNAPRIILGGRGDTLNPWESNDSLRSRKWVYLRKSIQNEGMAPLHLISILNVHIFRPSSSITISCPDIPTNSKTALSGKTTSIPFSCRSCCSLALSCIASKYWSSSSSESSATTFNSLGLWSDSLILLLQHFYLYNFCTLSQMHFALNLDLTSSTQYY